MYEILKEVFPLIEKLAPTFATIFLNPAAGLTTSFAVSLLSHKFGINPNELEKLPQAIKADPDCHDKLSQLEDSFGELFKQNAFHARNPSRTELNLKIEWDK